MNKKIFEEEWKPILGYEGLYEVSSLGRIRSIKRTVSYFKKINNIKTFYEKKLGGVELKQWIDKKGYSHVTLSKNNIKKRECVHKKVIEAFVGPCPYGQEVMHLENAQIKSDHSIKNLRYGSHTCNDAFKIDDGTEMKGEKHPNAILTEKYVLNIKKIRLLYGYSCRMIGTMFNTHYSNVALILKNKAWRTND